MTLEIPKNKPRKNRASSFYIIFGIFWLIFSLPFFFAGMSMLKTERLFVSTGVKTGAKIESKYVSESWDSKKKRTNSTYKVRYTFKDNLNQNITGESSVSKSVWDGYLEGSTLIVEYIPGQSQSKNRAEGSGSGAVGGYIFIAFSSLMMGIGLFCLFYFFKKLLLFKRLMSNGILTEGKVVEVGPSNLSVNGQRQWQLKYAFLDRMGKTYTGKSEYMSPSEGNSWTLGDKGKVRYDKDKPQSNIWLGKD